MQEIVTREDSILRSIATLVGGEEETQHFNTDLIIAINTALAVLVQVGVGPNEGFEIADETKTWKDFLGEDKRLNMAVSYVYMKVKMLFDPPQSSVLKEAMTEAIHETEWRAYIAADPASYPNAGDGA